MNKIPVLVIDDHEGFRRSVVHFLATTTRFDVVGEASNTKDGLELALTHRPRIVLLDIRMPGMSGLSIINQLRQELPDLIVVVLTLWDTQEYRQAALVENNADAYIIKENMVSELLPTLNQLLSGVAPQLPTP
jgi:DNA-binding NarL/FixJ family response regulator